MLEGVVFLLVMVGIVLLQLGGQVAAAGRAMFRVVWPELWHARSVVNALAVDVRTEGGCTLPAIHQLLFVFWHSARDKTIMSSKDPDLSLPNWKSCTSSCVGRQSNKDVLNT